AGAARGFDTTLCRHENECEYANTAFAFRARPGASKCSALLISRNMTEMSTSASNAVDERAAKFSASDGTALAGTWFEPARPRIASTVVVIVCGAGIPARFYHHFARFLCERGAAVLTFDYRGIGAARQGNLRK